MKSKSKAKSKSKSKSDKVTPKVRPEVQARFEKFVLQEFAKWQKAHPEVKVSSCTMSPIQVMLLAMAMDMSKLD